MALFGSRLPEGWAWEPLRKRYRITKKPRHLVYHRSDRVPFVPMEGVSAGGAAQIRYDMRTPEAIASGVYFERGDVLVARITPSFENGKQGKADDLPAPFGLASTELIPLQPLEEADPRYLFYYLLHPDVRAHLTGKMEGTTARQRVPDEALLELAVPVPLVEEQRRIASVLSEVRRAVTTEEQLASVTRELKQCVMQQLFARGLRGEEQKETDIGLIPASWSVEPLNNMREFLQYGTSVKCDYGSRGRPVLRIPNVVNGFVADRDLKRAEVSAAEEESLTLQAGDVLFVRTNGVRERVGSTAVYQGKPEGALFASYLIRARPRRDRLMPEFLQAFTETEAGRTQLSGRASPAADGKFNINTKVIDSLLVPHPDVAEQQRIMEIVGAIDAKLSAHERKRATLHEVFQRLLQDLMTGALRVGNAEAVAV